MGINRGSAGIVVAIAGTTVIAVAGLVALGQTVRGLLAAAFLAALVASCIGNRQVAGEQEIILLAFGEMLVLSAGVAGPAYAALLQVLVLGLVARESGMLASQHQMKGFVLFAAVASAGAGALLAPAHVLIPLLAVIATGTIAYLALRVSGYLQVSKLEAGA